jgi:hypothetical protein
MTSTELIAYHLILKNGTVDQVSQLLWDISRDEPEIPAGLLSDIIEALQVRGAEDSWKFAPPVHALLGKTKSLELYQAAEKLGYLELNRMYSKGYMSGKVDLFVNQLFYSEEAEKMAIDELFLWLTYFDQSVRQEYLKTQSLLSQLEDISYDRRLEKSQFFGCPLYPISQILNALSKIASPAGREALASLEYIFRPRLNEYRMAKQKQAANNGTAVASSDQDDESIGLTILFGWPSTKSLGAILDNIATIARGQVPA